ncbi:putative receptor-like protein kinase At3g47110 [Prunus persica]|uniref:putative receptor-like protein kinase At3g47110 n=1 Tax=Prunus persica TaxID=3760 RepID=UPI0009AB4DA0|nr:putative receptor-like protein kinase At3g47110 [Prunus persica]
MTGTWLSALLNLIYKPVCHAFIIKLRMGVLVMKLILLIYSLVNGALFVCSMHLRMGGNETDRLALLAIKAQIKQDPHNVLSSWNESIHFCSWHGVSCGRYHHQRQRVTKLNLQSQDLVGSLSPNVGNLSFLRELELQNNNFSSKIPPEIGNLGRLQVLSLHNNSFSGPIPYNISYCSNLIFMNFGFNGLVGNLSSLEPIPSMIGLKALEELDLSHNNLWCEIPKFLERFVSLKKLDLSFNDFWGEVPTGGAFKNASVILITGNPMLCGGIANLQLPKCESPKGGSSRSLIIRFVLSGLALLGIAMEMYYFFLCSSRKKRKEIPLSTLPNSLVQVSYATLLKATDEFSSANRIGAGSFGSVYRGVLYDDGKAQLVAVKVFNLLRHGASKSFKSECEALRNIRHRNLVKIMTACSSVDFHGHDFKALVYEYMERGSLEEWLHPPTEIEEVREALNLEQRLDIAIDVACTLDYLHNHCETPIVHCDLKPSNVLLDNEMTGHVSDFGLARFLSQKTGTNASENQTSSIGIKGTVGYAAPEYGMGSEVSTNGEVYSFGILLLEMFSGKRPTDDMFNGDLNLHTFVKMDFPERVMEIADSTLFEGGINERRVRKIESFIVECEALRNIKHRNLVKIITACSSVDFHGNDFKALVYEYMENGSLEEWLHPPTEVEEVREALNLEQRLDIAIDVACALDYLHNHCETPIVHCDLKPSNVLLDNEMTGHVSDFGLARFLSQQTGTNASENPTSSIGIKGTVGYAAPEYGMGNEVSTNGDVYSFGILLLEMFAGKRPTDDMFNGDLNLHTYVKMAFPNRVMEIVDSTLFEGGTSERRVQKIEVCLNSIFRIGIECSAESPTDRLKNISDAASELHSIRDVLLG